MMKRKEKCPLTFLINTTSIEQSLRYKTLLKKVARNPFLILIIWYDVVQVVFRGEPLKGIYTLSTKCVHSIRLVSKEHKENPFQKVFLVVQA